MSHKHQKEIEEVISMAYEQPPPDIVAARILTGNYVSEEDISKVMKTSAVNHVWLNQVRNAIRDLRLGIRT